VTPVLLSETIESYLDDCYALAAGTRDLYAYHLSRFLEAVGDRSMGRLKPSRVRSYLAGLRRQDGEPYSAHYLDQVYRTLNTFFRWCVASGALRANPMEGVRRPRVPKKKSPRLTLDEIERVLEAARRTANGIRDYAMILLAVDSGLRRNEIRELLRCNVDLEGGVVRVLGKGDKERDVPIGGTTVKALKAWLKVRPPGGMYVFVTREGKPLTRNGMQTLIYRLKAKSGIAQLRWHLLRHTFANHYVNGGGGLRRLQKVLGHADVSTTASIYLDPELDELKEAHRNYSPLAQMQGER
jgi:integrase/recombinase XerC